MVAVEVTVEFVVGALFGVLEGWLENGTPYSSERMALMFERLTGPAISAGLGLAQ